MSHSHLRAAGRVAVLLMVVAVSVPIYLIAYPFGRLARRTTSYPFFRCCVWMSGLKLRRDGFRPAGSGTLYAANHVSYLDIPVLAALTDGMFVAKSEVRTWPLIGFLARIGRTLFVSRRAAKVPGERVQIAAQLAKGEAIFLFAEGSSSDGTGVLPFRPGLMSAAQVDRQLSVTVQPVSIAYGPPSADTDSLTPEERDRYAWYGETELAPHLWQLFGMKRRTVVSVTFHRPRMSDEFGDARSLAAWAEQTVVSGLNRAYNVAPVDVEEDGAANAVPPALAVR